MPAGLTARQWDMLRLVVAAGYCGTIIPARAGSAWVVRLRVPGRPSVVMTYAQATGDALIRRRLIKPDPSTPTMRGPTGIIGRRYVPTAAAIALVAKGK